MVSKFYTEGLLVIIIVFFLWSCNPTPEISASNHSTDQFDLKKISVPVTPMLGLAFPSKYTEYYHYISDAGIGTVRLGVSWKYIQPQLNGIQWKNLDKRIASLQENGMDILLTLYSDAPWAVMKETTNVANAVPLKYQHWYNFVKMVVERYDGDGRNDMPGLKKAVIHYQVANEWISPDNKSGGWAGTTSWLIEYINVAYKAVHAASDKAQLILGGIAAFNLDVMLVASERKEFIVRQRWSESSETLFTVDDSRSDQVQSVIKQRVLPVIKKAHFDILDAHLYGPLERDYDRLQLLRDLTLQEKSSVKPILSTECGGPSLDYLSSYTPEDHFNEVIMRNLGVLAGGGQFCLWFGLGEEITTTWGNRRVPLFDMNRKPKPGYWAYKWLAWLINGSAHVTSPKQELFVITKEPGQNILVSNSLSIKELADLAGGYPVDVSCITDPVLGIGKLWRECKTSLICGSDAWRAVSKRLPAVTH